MNIKNFLIHLILSFNLFAYAENYEVKMLNQGSEGYMVFEPSVLKINKGDSVTFIATDAAHNSASIEGMIPPGASNWNGNRRIASIKHSNILRSSILWKSFIFT